ncbi:unnamed protein product [Pleuronectes platessa]|uniref:Uncharacterized protein n=1 Tax=Pleuronectes platessa TaxID=8262 RepID=A0A9N7UZC7_PLEPL|nr:unnamed protein product [Pleuronectes platessa]
MWPQHHKSRDPCHAPIDAPAPSIRPPDDKSHQSLRTESLRARMGVAPFQAVQAGLLAPAGSSETLPNLPDLPFPSLYLSCEETSRRYVRKCRASNTASQELFVGIAAKPGSGLAHELTAANAIYKSNII